jgi:3-phosphoshikimate 1-carboxyvinyltransferase
MIEIIPIHKYPAVNTQKSVRIPGSKSYTNRALLLAALAKGRSKIVNPLVSDDTLYMQNALRELGIKISKQGHDLIVEGTEGKFRKHAKALYLGNAGTAVRFLTAALAVTGTPCTITGDKRMRERPIADLIDALKGLGAVIDSSGGCPPIRIGAAEPGGTTRISGKISSQYISALLMAAPYAKRKVKITVKDKLTSLPYVRMTLDTMRRFGLNLTMKTYRMFDVPPGRYKSVRYVVEGDASSATYFWAIAALNGLKVKVYNIDLSSKQADIGFLDIIKKMGCRIEGGQNFVTVSGPATLKPLGTVNLEDMPDSAMTVAILAAFAKGKSVLKGLSTLRVKECDRLSALTAELKKIGASVTEGKDFLEILGNPDTGNSTVIETYNDHRMAMCFAVAGTHVPGIRISGPECVAKTYPGFWKDLKKLGIRTKYRDRAKNKKNIILGGLRGTGKTLIGKNLAQLLKRKFLDTDGIIEKKAKMPISRIVRENGWETFRKMESETAKSLAGVDGAVISTGGGMLVNQANARTLKKNGVIILLKCDPAISAKRTDGDANRPALTRRNSVLKEHKDLWEQRKKTYLKTADLVIDTSAQSANINADTQKKAAQIINLIHDGR